MGRGKGWLMVKNEAHPGRSWSLWRFFDPKADQVVVLSSFERLGVCVCMCLFGGRERERERGLSCTIRKAKCKEKRMVLLIAMSKGKFKV